MHFVSVPSHLTECRRTKGDEWEKCTDFGYVIENKILHPTIPLT